MSNTNSNTNSNINNNNEIKNVNEYILEAQEENNAIKESMLKDLRERVGGETESRPEILEGLDYLLYIYISSNYVALKSIINEHRLAAANFKQKILQERYYLPNTSSTTSSTSNSKSIMEENYLNIYIYIYIALVMSLVVIYYPIILECLVNAGCFPIHLVDISYIYSFPKRT